MAFTVRDLVAAAKEPVERELQTVQAFVDDSGATSLAPQIHEARAQLARLFGNQDEYESKLREARRLYTEMGARGHAQRLAKELGL
jgi:hypothetical protein